MVSNSSFNTYTILKQTGGRTNEEQPIMVPIAQVTSSHHDHAYHIARMLPGFYDWSTRTTKGVTCTCRMLTHLQQCNRVQESERPIPHFDLRKPNALREYSIMLSRIPPTLGE